MPERPHVSREDGGHLWAVAKDEHILRMPDRTKLTPDQAVELIRLTMLAGESYVLAMKNRGIEIVRINYQENGNWSYKPDSIARGEKPFLHVHLYGRRWGKRDFPEALIFPPRESGFYDDFEPLNEGDIAEIRKQISLLENTEKYQLANWGL